MKESIKKIILSLLIILVAILIFLFLINDFTTSPNNQKLKQIGIDSRTINIDILDNKIFCEDVILFDMSSKKKLPKD